MELQDLPPGVDLATARADFDPNDWRVLCLTIGEHQVRATGELARQLRNAGLLGAPAHCRSPETPTGYALSGTAQEVLRQYLTALSRP